MRILWRPKWLYSFGTVNSASDCSGIIHVNEVAFVWGVESIFRKCTIRTSATDLRSFLSNLVVLLLSSELTACRGDFCRLL